MYEIKTTMILISDMSGYEIRIVHHLEHSKTLIRSYRVKSKTMQRFYNMSNGYSNFNQDRLVNWPKFHRMLYMAQDRITDKRID